MNHKIGDRIKIKNHVEVTKYYWGCVGKIVAKGELGYDWEVTLDAPHNRGNICLNDNELDKESSK
jgi:hypothetical protein